jgi:hypothetical protein
VQLKGDRTPDLARLNAAPADVHWDRAATTVGIADLRGTLAVSPLAFGDRQVTLGRRPIPQCSRRACAA